MDYDLIKQFKKPSPIFLQKHGIEKVAYPKIQFEAQYIKDILSMALDITRLMSEVDQLRYETPPKKQKQLYSKSVQPSQWFGSEDGSQHNWDLNNLKIEKQTSRMMKKKECIVIQQIPSYMMPKGNLRERTIQQLIHKEVSQKMRLQELQELKKSKTTLGQFYKQHEPLYKRSEKSRIQKKQAIAESIQQQSWQEMKQVTFKPKINESKYEMEDFEERMKKSEQRKMFNEKKVIQQILKPLTFHPKINQNYNSQQLISKLWNSPGKTYEKTKNKISFSGEREQSGVKLKQSADLSFLLNKQ